MLRIRKSSLLFRLRTAEQVLQRVKFYNTGPYQIPGLLVICIVNPALDLDPEISMVLTLINASKEPHTFGEASLQGIPFELHPVQANSQDPALRASRYDGLAGTFYIPGRTTAVFLARP
jgi:hypothetical protein